MHLSMLSIFGMFVESGRALGPAGALAFWPVLFAAQAPVMEGGLPDPKSYQAIGWAVAVAFVLMGGLALYLNIRVNQKSLNTKPAQAAAPTPQPLIVEQAKVFVTLPELDKRLNDVKSSLDRDNKYLHDSFHKVSGDLNAIRLEMEDRGNDAGVEIAKLREQVSVQGATLSAVKEKADHTNAMVSTFNQKLDRAIEREITRQTGR
jgi:hypothetical protein